MFLEPNSEEEVIDNQDKTVQIKQLVEHAQDNLEKAKELFFQLAPAEKEELSRDRSFRAPIISSASNIDNGQVIEGIFDGQEMIGSNDQRYSVPANYASKSKLVGGDTLKLTIKSDGSFIYKQIGPVARKRLIGELIQDQNTNEYKVKSEGADYRVLLASVTYFDAEVGDQIIILTAEDSVGGFAAVENVVKNGNNIDEVSLELGL